MREIRDLLK